MQAISLPRGILNKLGRILLNTQYQGSSLIDFFKKIFIASEKFIFSLFDLDMQWIGSFLPIIVKINPDIKEEMSFGAIVINRRKVYTTTQ